jgi:hypothetical protein
MASNSHDTDTENEDEGGDDEGNAKFARNCSVDHPASTCESLARDELLGGIAYYTCVVKRSKTYCRHPHCGADFCRPRRQGQSYLLSWTRRTTTSTHFIVQRKALQTSSHPIISDWLVMRGQKSATSPEIALPIPTTSTTPSLPSPVSSYSSLSAHSNSVSPYSTRPPGNSTTSASTGVRCRTTIETASDPSGSTTRAMMYTQLGDRLVCISISVEPQQRPVDHTRRSCFEHGVLSLMLKGGRSLSLSKGVSSSHSRVVAHDNGPNECST